MSNAACSTRPMRKACCAIQRIMRARKARREALERKWTFVSKPTPTTCRPVEGSDSDEFSDDEGGAAAGAEPATTRLPFRPADG